MTPCEQNTHDRLLDFFTNVSRRSLVVGGDMLDVLNALPDRAVDLTITSPPYENARTYGELEFNVSGEDWVKWAHERFVECVRVTRGLTAWVIEGKTSNYKYSSTPFMLVTDLHRSGVCLRKPAIFKRNGIPGSGGPDWLRNDYELIVCATHDRGRLPWSNNKAAGHPPKCPPGGRPSHRTKSGERVSTKVQTRRKKDGTRARDGQYKPPDISNPGNVIAGKVGGGLMGSSLAHENEAPYPEWLVEPFILSFCPPGGIVLDVFGGSGTTMAVALKHGRRCLSIDKRYSQLEIMSRRRRELGDVGKDWDE